MSQIVWISFSLCSLFSWSSRKDLSLKNFNEYSEYEGGLVEAVTGSKNPDDNVFYKISDLPPNYPIYNDCLVLNTNGSIGYCFYYDHDIVSPTSSVHVLIHKNANFNKIMNKTINLFLSKIISFIFTSGPYNRCSCLIDNNKFNREIILLPCIEVGKNEEYIWNERGKYYTLAVDYINNLMISARKLREKNTIELYKAQREKYESEREKYESEREKYENANLAEKKNVIWLPHTLGSLFDRNTYHHVGTPKKSLDEVDSFDYEHPIKNITATKNNNGCSGYLRDEGEILEKKKRNLLTIATDAAYGGVCFYQQDYFVSTGHTNILEIKNPTLHRILDKSPLVYLFLAKNISKIMHIREVNRFERSIANDFDREIILLPCIEVGKNEEYIWNERGKYYTLAVDYINYIYLTGEIKYYDNMIKKYDYGN